MRVTGRGIERRLGEGGAGEGGAGERGSSGAGEKGDVGRCAPLPEMATEMGGKSVELDELLELGSSGISREEEAGAGQC